MISIRRYMIREDGARRGVGNPSCWVEKKAQGEELVVQDVSLMILIRRWVKVERWRKARSWLDGGITCFTMVAVGGWVVSIRNFDFLLLTGQESRDR